MLQGQFSLIALGRLCDALPCQVKISLDEEHDEGSGISLGYTGVVGVGVAGGGGDGGVGASPTTKVTVIWQRSAW